MSDCMKGDHEYIVVRLHRRWLRDLIVVRCKNCELEAVMGRAKKSE